MKKKISLIIILFLTCIISIICFLNTPEKKTIRYFNNHKTVLEEDAKKTIEYGRPANTLNITADYWRGEHSIVEYTVISKGIVSASTYYGLFYSLDDTPVSFQNSGCAMKPVSDSEWTWNANDDNSGIVRRLAPNWFYFEASL